MALAISDTGPTGIDAPAGTAAPAAVRTGLGLALVYSTVQLAGGRIRLESLPGRGSTVRILLPRATGSWAAEAGGSDPVDVAEPDRHRPLVPGRTSRAAPAVIVVVEDEPGVRSLVERVLERAGHRVLAFADGTSAADRLGDPNIPLDLLITDLVMPGPNGIEVARRARRIRPELAVLLMSGYAADALRAEGIDEGSIELLAKPFSTAELLERVAALLPNAPREG